MIKLGSLYPRPKKDEDIVKVSISKTQMMDLVSVALDRDGVIKILFDDIEIITRGG